MSFTYLASPFSHADELVRWKRYDAACRVAGRLMAKGEAIFAPIPHSYPIENVSALPTTTEFWMSQDLPILRYASKLKVLKLDGWETSKGVAREILFAEALGIPVEYVEYADE